ncbi:MAG TPA: N-acetylmuramoyl-L-alanine amidase [Vicinamibacterales bacterium]|nr:N-acetylmuramoyl-L-alanine amidase [Vicinamibacterales bacterium]
MREQTHRLIHPRPALMAGVFLLTACVFWPAGSRAQTPAATLYEQAQAAEQTARADSPASPDALRKVAKTYENLVLRYPTSGYADNALWQAAGLFTAAFQSSADAADRQQAERLLKWLKQEYPTSPFLKRVDGAIQTLEQAPSGPAAPQSAPPPPPPDSPPASPPVPTTLPASGPAAVVKGITQSVLPHGERITIEFSKEVAFTGDRVENPDRVFFDFANATAPASLIDHAPAPSGSLVKALRIGRHPNSVTRIVLELAGSPRYSAFPMYDPFRLVIDVESADAGAPAPTPAVTPVPKPTPPPTTVVAPPPAMATSAKTREREKEKDAAPPPAADPPAPTRAGGTPVAGTPEPPSSNRSGEYSLSRQLGLGVSRIVLDAGHGGHDPGAQANGIDESELTLDVAQRLQKLLEAQPGFAVVLTRSTDDYIALEERTAIANREGADLFLSIHANASKQPAASGIETYFLNFATNPTAEAVAARENASSGQNMGTLPDILKAIALNNKLAESRELASIVQTSLVRRLSQQNRTIRDLGVKQAPFVVLIGAQMPSILAEISFLTNRSDATLLKQGSYRQKIAQALCDAIVKYQASLKKVTVASRSPER